MKAEVRIGLQEGRNRFGLMRTQVIGNDMDFFAWRLAESDLAKELDKLGAGMARAGLAQHLTSVDVERSVQRQGAMAVVLKAMPFGPSWRERQHRIEPIQGLDGSLFIQAEDCGVRRWVKIQANDVRRLLFKFRIVAGHIAAQPVG